MLEFRKVETNNQPVFQLYNTEEKYCFFNENKIAVINIKLEQNVEKFKKN
jgi:hypothetical protein